LIILNVANIGANEALKNTLIDNLFAQNATRNIQNATILILVKVLILSCFLKFRIFYLVNMYTII
jgi:hypothetical protein